MMSETDSEPVAIEDVPSINEGEPVRVEYDSAYGGRQELTGVVERVETEVEAQFHGGIFYVYVSREGDEYPSRRLHVMVGLDEIEVEGKNGGRWNRISSSVAHADVFRDSDDPDPEAMTDGGVQGQVCEDCGHRGEDVSAVAVAGMSTEKLCKACSPLSDASPDELPAECQHCGSVSPDVEPVIHGSDSEWLCPDCSPLRADGGDTPESLANAVSQALASSDLPLNRVSVSVGEVNGDVTVQGNGPMGREGWEELRDSITDELDSAGFTYKAKPQWAFVEVTGREGEQPVMTDGGKDMAEGEGELETQPSNLPNSLSGLDFQNLTGVDGQPIAIGGDKRFRGGKLVLWAGEDSDDAEAHAFELDYSQVNELADLFQRMSEDIALDEDSEDGDSELMTDGGVSIATDGGAATSPEDAGDDADDPYREVKVKLAETEPVLMVSTIGEDGEYIAVWRDEDADEDELEKYRLVMDLADFIDVDPYSTLNEDPGGVDGENVTLDLWTPKEAMTDGGCKVSDGPGELETEVKRALSDAGILHAVEVKQGGDGVSIHYTGAKRARITNALEDAGLATTGSGEFSNGPEGEYISGKVRVTAVQNGGEGDE